MATAFQDTITRRAVALAKTLRHERAERSHVLVVIAETLARDDAAAALTARLRAALPPHGSAFRTPTLSPEAEALIAECPSPAEAAAMLAHLEAAGPAGGAAQPSAVAHPAAQAASVDPAMPSPAGSVTQLLAELDALVGLASVKRQVRRVIAVVEANRVRAASGARPVAQSLHLVFTGRPGTGKTTVARIVARLYGASGALKGSRFREVTRTDLIGQYVGQTAPLTAQVMDSVRPGVLFIDEAYALNASLHGDFAEECVATLVKGMEDYRTELAIIVAGYRDEMRAFINSNPGLRSRFQTFIDFPDYSPAELVQIYAHLAGDAGIRLGDGVQAAVEKAIHGAARHPNFGNARFVRALWEESFANLAVRANADGEITLTELGQVEPRDVPADMSAILEERRPLGFPRRGAVND